MTNETTIAVTWENDVATGVTIVTKQTAEQEGAINEVTFLRGVTDEPKPKSKVKAMANDAEAVSNNWKNATKALVKALGFDASQTSIDGEPTWPETGDETPVAAKTWQEADTDGMLAVYAPQAASGFAQVEEGEGKVKEGSRAIGEAVAAASELLSAKVFDTWLKDASARLFAHFERNKNAKAEFAFLGNMDGRFYGAVPDGIISPKAMQKRYNDTKAFIAEQSAEMAARNVKGNVAGALTVEQATNTLLEVLDEAANKVKFAAGGVSVAELNAFGAMHYEALNGRAFDLLSKDEAGVFSAAKDGDNKPVVPGLAIRKEGVANELLTAFAKALNYEASRATVEQEQAAKAEAATKAEAVNPRTFSQYTVREASAHLAVILSVHGDWAEVLSGINRMADEVDGGSAWDDVIAATLALVATEQANEAAETEADDEA